MTTLSIEQIKEQFPDEWVLLGNPETFGAKVLSGIVVFHSKDKREIAYSHINWRENFNLLLRFLLGRSLKIENFGYEKKYVLTLINLKLQFIDILIQP